MSHDNDARKANAEARFKKAEVKAAEGAQAKAAHEAGIVARDANTERLKGLRLARDETDRLAAAAEKAKSPKPRASRSSPSKADVRGPQKASVSESSRTSEGNASRPRSPR